MTKIRHTIAAGLLAGALSVPAATATADDHGKFRVPPGHLPPPGTLNLKEV